MRNLARRGWDTLRRLDPRLLDGILAVTLSVAAGVQLLTEEPGNFPRMLWVLGTCLPLVIRRRLPILCNVLQVGCSIMVQRTPVSISLLAIFIGLYSVGVYSRWRVPFLAWLAFGSVLLAVSFPDSRTNVPSWASLLVGGLAVWLAGNAMHQLHERALQLEREQELNMRIARAEERQTIARELHDVVAHSVSVMVVQAGAARTTLTRQPEQSAEALRAVESSGREALSELRHLLGLLTETEAEPALAPQPGLDQIDDLVERVERAGLPVDLKREGTPRPLSPGLDLTAYRIVQEALTNALKYASGAHTEVHVVFDEHQLRLEILDAGGNRLDTSNGAGRGLVGMRERVSMYGGELHAGQRAEGGFAVRARLPLETQ